MHVHVDLDLCQSHGECCFAAPEVFHLDDDDNLQYVEHPDESQRDAVEQAVLSCPVAAITLTD